MSLARIFGHERTAEEGCIELGLLCGGEDSASGDGWCRVDEDFERVEHLVVIGKEGLG